jgi:hypothetical protein
MTPLVALVREIRETKKEPRASTGFPGVYEVDVPKLTESECEARLRQAFLRVKERTKELSNASHSDFGDHTTVDRKLNDPNFIPGLDKE